MNLPWSISLRLSGLLVGLRYGSLDATGGTLALFFGYVDGLCDSGVIERDVKKRLDALAINAFAQLSLRGVRS